MKTNIQIPYMCKHININIKIKNLAQIFGNIKIFNPKTKFPICSRRNYIRNSLTLSKISYIVYIFIIIKLIKYKMNLIENSYLKQNLDYSLIKI